jgi:hypothetical protein
MPSPEMPDEERYAHQLNYAFGQISEFQELIRFADTKAGAAITIESGLLAVLAPSISAMLPLLTSPVKPWQFWIALPILILSFGFFVAFLGVLYYAFLTFIPRLEKREYTPTIAFFLDCYNMGEEAFIQNVSTMSPEVLLKDMLREVYLLSEILVPKFKAQRLCFTWLKFVLVFWSLAQFGIWVIL